MVVRLQELKNVVFYHDIAPEDPAITDPNTSA
jgi:hypothetical protein